ncbi:MAG: hypothetical protein OXB94_10175 [Nitrospira sp.]|nr:hypothetical protein [Nitrospira sp.]
MDTMLGFFASIQVGILENNAINSNGAPVSVHHVARGESVCSNQQDLTQPLFLLQGQLPCLPAKEYNDGGTSAIIRGG